LLLCLLSSYLVVRGRLNNFSISTSILERVEEHICKKISQKNPERAKARIYMDNTTKEAK
jgi:hypothetical protein